jgi:hypothetical protein
MGEGLFVALWMQLAEVPIHRVFAGRNTSIACGSNGSMVFVWGCGDGKNLGIPGLVGDVYVPALLRGLEGQSIVDIAITDSMCCYLTASGCVGCVCGLTEVVVVLCDATVRLQLLVLMARRLYGAGDLAPGMGYKMSVAEGVKLIAPFTGGSHGDGSSSVAAKAVSACGTVMLVVGAGRVWSRGYGCLGQSMTDSWSDFR